MLYFSTKVEYGLQLLMELAKQPGVISLKQVAQQTKMPYRYLNKISHDLKKARLILPKEGKNGGFILAKKPNQITVKQILTALNEPLILARCLAHQRCYINNQLNCPTKAVWSKIKKNIDKDLQKITLKSLIK